MFTVLGIIAVVALIGWWVYWAFFDTYHLATVREGVLYRDGVRTMHQFQLAVNKTHVKTIVSLVDDREIGQSPFVEEAAFCREKGIDVVRVPVTLGGWPSGEEVKRFLEIANDPARQPVLVHCAQGVRRTGMMVAAYERSVLKMDKEQALAAMQSFGHSARTTGDIRRFIEVYDPATQMMTEELPVSSE
ncbi:MAG: tyrosine-protein phosphatase [Planctomycetota bacterium]|nr:tyrosine-protein phosphatase [Planctomycetota bacterium]